MTTETATTANCTPEPIWASGGIHPATGMFSAFTDYRWQCGCGHRCDHSGRVEIGTQHAAHLARVTAARDRVAAMQADYDRAVDRRSNNAGPLSCEVAALERLERAHDNLAAELNATA